MCGLRPGELLGLRSEDIDAGRPGGDPGPPGGQDRAGRGRCQEATVILDDLEDGPLPANAGDAGGGRVDAGRRCAGTRPLSKLRLGSAWKVITAWCSRARHGSPRRPEPVPAAGSARSSAGGQGSARDGAPHLARHTFVSILSDAGVDIDRIANAAGHINSNVTKTVYRHVLADKLSDAAPQSW